jgi:hypothetical protein
MQAHDRFEMARRDKFNHLPALHALFEALAWTYSIDNKLGKPADVPELRGLRWARRHVHHQWVQALWMDMGTDLPFTLPARVGVVSEWRWRERLGRHRESKPDADRDAYVSQMAGRPARETLARLRERLAPLVTR